MAGNLPVNLLEEAGQMMQRVLHAELPAERWSDIASTLNRVDYAVQAGEEVPLRRELLQLRWVVGEPDFPLAQGTPPPSAYGASPPPPYGASPPPYGAPTAASRPRGRSHKPVLWVILALVAGLCALPLAVVFIEPRATQSGTEPPGDAGVQSWWFVGVPAVLAVVVVVIAVVINFRRKSLRSQPAPAAVPRPLVAPPHLMPAPAQVREQANRTIMSLAARGGRT